MKQIEIYQKSNGQQPFKEWLNNHSDGTKARIIKRIDRVSHGNYGDFKSAGDKVLELRLFFGSGYRVYFSEVGKTIVLLLCAGDKSSQKKDIKLAKEFLADFIRRENG